MEFTVYRDLRSISFVRCLSRIPSSSFFAEGCAFTIATAKEKCRSEVIEREFQLSHSDPLSILGIAAHPIAESAEENAWNETLETLLLERLRSHSFLGVPIPFAKHRLWLGRIQDRFVCLALFPHAGSTVGVQSICKNPLKAILKTWAECRNIKIYSPAASDLPSYTKANRLLGAEFLRKLDFRPSTSRNGIHLPKLRKNFRTINQHHIAYYTKEST